MELLFNPKNFQPQEHISLGWRQTQGLGSEKPAPADHHYAIEQGVAAVLTHVGVGSVA